MPLKLSVGLTQKKGMPNYGSVGASCHVEVELDGSLLQGDLDGFYRHVRNVFLSCRQAVHDELARHEAEEVNYSSMQPINGSGDSAVMTFGVLGILTLATGILWKERATLIAHNERLQA